MKFILVLVIFGVIRTTAYSQSNSFSDTIKYELTGFSKKECVNKFKDKLSKMGVSDTLSISVSEENDIYIGKGKIPYNHIINFDTSDAFLNKTYVGQIQGFVNYKVRIEFQKKIIVVSLLDFEHIAKGNKYGKKSMGLINFNQVPNKSKDEELVWLDKVFRDVIESSKKFNVGFKLWFLNTML